MQINDQFSSTKPLELQGQLQTGYMHDKEHCAEQFGLADGNAKGLAHKIEKTMRSQ